MPNHCFNVIKAPKRVLNQLYDGEKITFEKLIPMPKTMDLREGTVIEDAIAYVISKMGEEELLKYRLQFVQKKLDLPKSFWNTLAKTFSKDDIEKLEEKAKKYIPNEEEKVLGIKSFYELGVRYLNNAYIYGSLTWYDWSIKNWGTKWDAYECKGTPEDGELSFLTAWAAPVKIMEAIFKRYPKQKIEWEYETEGDDYKVKVFSDGKGNVLEQKERILTEESEENEEEEE